MVLAGKSLAEAVRTGNAAGALSKTKRGPMACAARPDEIKAIMNFLVLDPRISSFHKSLPNEIGGALSAFCIDLLFS